MFLLTFALSSLVTNFYAFVLLFGFMSNFGCGFFYSILVYIAVKCFPSNQGLMTGLVMFTVGAGSILFTLLSKSLINPENKEPGVL